MVEVRNGVREKDLMGGIEDRRPRAVIDLDLPFQGIFETREMSGIFRLEMIGGISEKGHCQHCPTHFPLVGEVDTVDEGGATGTSIDAEEGPILKSGMKRHPGAGPATGIGRGKCVTTEIANVILKPAGGRTTIEGRGRNAKERIVSEGSNPTVQTLEIPQVDNRRRSHLVQLQ